MKQKLDKIFDFCQTNRQVYNGLIKKAKLDNAIMPFIGADLIAFNYGTKKDFLETLISANNLKDKRDELLTDDYLESLDRILNTLTLGVKDYKELIEWVVFEDYYSVNSIDLYQAMHEPINLIQWLNDGSAITVNFDKVYESLNNNKRFDLATPYNRLLLNHFMRKDSSLGSVIFKVHGDLFSSPKEVILTKDEFTKAYANSDFIDMLQKWINQYILLFIGIDICKDKYLKQILEKTRQEGVKYYAIIGCQNDDEKKKELFNEYAAMHIFPILYDINEPDSLRIILHKILVDSQKKEWKKSFDKGTLHYLYDDQLVLGREDQIKSLIKFTEDERSFLFCTINGKTVSGKSKLAYEFAQTYLSTWRWYMIPVEQIDDFIKNQPIVFKNTPKRKHTLVIFDDYSLYEGSLDQITNFINSIKQYCLKLRIIFVATDLKESNIASEGHKKCNRKYFWSKNYIYCNLFLGPMDEKEIMKIAIQYIQFRQRELGLENFEDWEKSNSRRLSAYIVDVLQENPNEALLLSMIYAVKLVLNYLNPNENEPDHVYVQRELYQYAISEASGVSYNKGGINRKKLLEKVNSRVDRTEKYTERLSKIFENIEKDTSLEEISEQGFSNLFEESTEGSDYIRVKTGD